MGVICGGGEHRPRRRLEPVVHKRSQPRVQLWERVKRLCGVDVGFHQLSVDVNDLLGHDSAARVGWAPLLVCDSESDNGVDGSSNGVVNSNENQPPLAASEISPPTANENQPAPKWGQLWTPEDAVCNSEIGHGSEGASNDGSPLLMCCSIVATFLR